MKIKNEYVIRCENSGIISTIISENMNRSTLFNPGEFWLQYVQAYSLIKALDFFSGLKSQTHKANEELIFLRNHRLYTLGATGAKDGEDHVILHFTVISENLLFEELMNSNNEQTDLHRNALKMLSVRDSSLDETTHEIFEEISRMNNEIVNAQRELACKNKELIEKLESLVVRDPLTNLYNRGFFEEELRRHDVPRNLPISIVMADVNGLKLINDSFGHSSGDDMLKRTAKLIMKACREDDVVARLGGDEFVVLLAKSGKEDAANLIKRIKDEIAEEEIGSIPLSVSFGHATKIEDGLNMKTLLKEAEDHMYRHKLHESTGARARTVTLIINTLYAKNHREMLHSLRVGSLSATIATSMGYSIDDVNQIKTAGLLHDIGKIGIEDRILNKTEPLSEQEWDEIKKHCDIGHRILSSVPEFSEIAEFVLEHQERWDGKGYPRGLKGLEISKEARIITVADAFDAMTGERTYGRVFSAEEAIKELQRCSGTQFDPEIVNAIVRSFNPLGV